MAKSKSQRLDDIFHRLWPNKPLCEAYTDLLTTLTELGDITRCKHETAKLIQKLDEME